MFRYVCVALVLEEGLFCFTVLPTYCIGKRRSLFEPVPLCPRWDFVTQALKRSEKLRCGRLFASKLLLVSQMVFVPASFYDSPLLSWLELELLPISSHPHLSTHSLNIIVYLHPPLFVYTLKILELSNRGSQAQVPCGCSSTHVDTM